MKINEFMTENFQTVSINGILRSLNSDEKRIYTQVKNSEDGKLPKDKLGEYDLRIANDMVTKGLLTRRKNPQHEIYFTAKGRRKCALKDYDNKQCPPDRDIKQWIENNEEKYQEKYGKDYKSKLYSKAWNKFNGKSLTESARSVLKEDFLRDYLWLEDKTVKAKKTGEEFTVKKVKEDMGEIIVILQDNDGNIYPYNINNLFKDIVVPDQYSQNDNNEWDGDYDELEETVYTSKYSRNQEFISSWNNHTYRIARIHFDNNTKQYIYVLQDLADKDLSRYIREDEMDEFQPTNSYDKDDNEWDGDYDELEEDTVFDHSWYEVENGNYPKRTKEGVIVEDEEPKWKQFDKSITDEELKHFEDYLLNQGNKEHYIYHPNSSNPMEFVIRNVAEDKNGITWAHIIWANSSSKGTNDTWIKLRSLLVSYKEGELFLPNYLDYGEEEWDGEELDEATNNNYSNIDEYVNNINSFNSLVNVLMDAELEPEQQDKENEQLFSILLNMASNNFDEDDDIEILPDYSLIDLASWLDDMMLSYDREDVEEFVHNYIKTLYANYGDKILQGLKTYTHNMGININLNYEPNDNEWDGDYDELEN